MIPLKDDNPSRTIPVVTILLIVANVFIFLYFSLQGDVVYNRVVVDFGLIPREILTFNNIPGSIAVHPLMTFFSSTFLHGGFWHLGGNMLFLWIFGDNIEDRFGHLRYLLFYLIGGALAALIHLLSDPQSLAPMIGASGAISAVLGSYALLFPKARVHTLIIILIFIRVVPIPAVFFLGFWFLNQVLSSMQAGSNVAWFAHIGGFAWGILVAIFFIGTRRR